MRIALLGYGKMGKAIEAVAKGRKHRISLIVDEHNANEITADDLKKSDVAIEFSTPKTAYANILKCFDAGIPVVCGTTGWLEKLEEAKKLCKTKKKTLFYASNFSIGVNLFFEVNKTLARLMDKQPQYKVSIHEVHHTEKKDAPSGTAITLASGIIENMERKKKWVNKNCFKNSELSILSYREPDVPGIHIINYESETDSIEIKHTAHSRMGFASGAVLAAEWVHNKKGYFEMRDYLKF